MSSSSSSAIEISSDYQTSRTSSSAASVYHHRNRNLSTDLRLGLSISPSDSNLSSDSPQIRKPKEKQLLRTTLAGKSCSRRHRRRRDSLLIKVFMEGIPIGRKVDLVPHDGYDSLISTLSSMFETGILRPCDTDYYRDQMNYHNVLTYEDKEGDWMMAGDVPWEMFLSTVKRLKITRADKC